MILRVGFDEQKFVPSPLDELAKLQLTEEEVNIDTPEAQQQIQYVEYAVANKSLGSAFQVHPTIQQFLNYYQGRGRKTMEVGLYRSGMFMRMARRIFREEGVPENVAWLGQVESAGNRRLCHGLPLPVCGNLFPEREHVSVCVARLTLMSETVLKKQRGHRPNI